MPQLNHRSVKQASSMEPATGILLVVAIAARPHSHKCDIRHRRIPTSSGRSQSDVWMSASDESGQLLIPDWKRPSLLRLDQLIKD